MAPFLKGNCLNAQLQSVSAEKLTVKLVLPGLLKRLLNKVTNAVERSGIDHLNSPSRVDQWLRVRLEGHSSASEGMWI